MYTLIAPQCIVELPKVTYLAFRGFDKIFSVRRVGE